MQSNLELLDRVAVLEKAMATVCAGSASDESTDVALGNIEARLDKLEAHARRLEPSVPSLLPK